MRPQPIGCAIVVQNTKGQILLGKRLNSYKSGLYGLPGGQVEGREKLLECAKRELSEETGLSALEIKYLGVVREWQEVHAFIHFVFVCREWDGELEVLEPEKCAGWEWHDIDNLPEILPGHKAAIELLEDMGGLRDI